MSQESNDKDDRTEREQTARLEALFRADPGPTSSELAEARLLLKRSFARERSGAAVAAADGGGALVRFVPRRALWIASQAAGFLLLVALLVPVLPRVLPSGNGTSAGAGVGLVASLADEARSVHARIRPWLPSLPSLPPLALPSSMSLERTEMRGSPAGGLFDWVPSLHSDAR